MSHTCHAIGCENNCKPEYLMCPTHWGMLPKLRKVSVLREYRAGQCQNNPTPSIQWHDAADAAIYWIHIAELKKAARQHSTPTVPHEDSEQLRLVKNEVESLAMSIWKQHFQEGSPDFELLDTPAGVVSQLDNMYAGLRQEIDTLKFNKALPQDAAELVEGLLDAKYRADNAETCTSYTQHEKDTLVAKFIIAKTQLLAYITHTNKSEPTGVGVIESEEGSKIFYCKASKDHHVKYTPNGWVCTVCEPVPIDNAVVQENE